MPQISLTDLVDIVSTSGTPKATKVAKVKARPDYEPAHDFYKPLRERIVDVHRDGDPKTVFTAFLQNIADPRKRANYPSAVTGYKKWWGQKMLTWFGPPRTTYAQHGVEVMINPELGLDVNGTRYLVKLYFKDAALSKLRVDIITLLMETSLRPRCEKDEVMSVLDVRRGKLFRLQATSSATIAMVDAELAYVAALWPQV
jgi:hypothetical protein